MRAIWDIYGFLYFVAANQFITAMQPVVLTFPIVTFWRNKKKEREIFLKESNMKMYRTSTYFIGKTFPEIPFLIIISVFENKYFLGHIYNINILRY